MIRLSKKKKKRNEHCIKIVREMSTTFKTLYCHKKLNVVGAKRLCARRAETSFLCLLWCMPEDLADVNPIQTNPILIANNSLNSSRLVTILERCYTVCIGGLPERCRSITINDY